MHNINVNMHNINVNTLDPCQKSAFLCRLALVTAAKAIAFAVTPGMEKIKFATMWSQRRGIGPYVEFVRSEESLDPEVHPEMMEVLDWKTNYKVSRWVGGLYQKRKAGSARGG